MNGRKLLTAGLVFCSGIAVNVGSGFLKEPNWTDGVWLGLGALMLPLAWVLQPRLAVYPRFAATKVKAGRRKVLILFLSAVRDVPAPDWVNQLLTDNLEADLRRLAETKRDAPDRRWSWEQPLRGIHHHLRENAPLERLILIGSTVSVAQIPAFHQILLRYPQFQGQQGIQALAFLKNQMELKPVENLSGAPAQVNGFEFEDFDDITSALLAAINQIKATGYADKDIQIDYTGGQKPASVVAAAITFGNYLTNQYVATNPSDANQVVFDVWGYDVKEELPRAES